MRANASFALTVGALLFSAWPSHAEIRTFREPQHQGYRLDYCQSFGRVCGERVAVQWCHAQGYEYASDWAVDRDIGALQPTVTIDDGRLCGDGACDGFASISCGRDGRSFRMPNLGAASRNTVITPDRLGAAPAVDNVEIQLLVPGCHQTEPGVLLCASVHDFQHCRTLFAAGKLFGCRAGMAFDGNFAEPIAAPEGSYDLRVRSRASVAVTQGQRGQGRTRGEARFRIAFAVPADPDSSEICLQRDRYLYIPTGPEGGLAEIGETADCSKPIEGQFAPHDDDLLRAYDLCAGHMAWGSSIDDAIDMLVAGLYYLSSTSSSERYAGAARVVAPYATVRAPLTIDCRR